MHLLNSIKCYGIIYYNCVHLIPEIKNVCIYALHVQTEGTFGYIGHQWCEGWEESMRSGSVTYSVF
jgi:hypothetical protein